MPPRRKSSVVRRPKDIQDMIMKIEENSFSKTPREGSVKGR